MAPDSTLLVELLVTNYMNYLISYCGDKDAAPSFLG
jgi:hypothetical protein